MGRVWEGWLEVSRVLLGSRDQVRIVFGGTCELNFNGGPEIGIVSKLSRGGVLLGV